MRIISYIVFFGLLCNVLSAQPPDDLITSAEKLVQFKKDTGSMEGFIAPQSVIICYQPSTLQHLLEQNSDFEKSKSFSNLYVSQKSNVGILGGWGIGAPALAIQVELLAAVGVKRFIGVGTAGALLNKFEIGDFVIATKALGEDGVAHLYLDGPNFAEGNLELNAQWRDYASDLNFYEATAWSFSAFFRERYSDVIRVVEKGCDVVEMETATLFAIVQERGLEAMALYVVSDVINLEPWVPRLRDPSILDKVNFLADRALQFCQESL